MITGTTWAFHAYKYHLETYAEQTDIGIFSDWNKCVVDPNHQIFSQHILKASARAVNDTHTSLVFNSLMLAIMGLFLLLGFCAFCGYHQCKWCYQVSDNLDDFIELYKKAN